MTENEAPEKVGTEAPAKEVYAACSLASVNISVFELSVRVQGSARSRRNIFGVGALPTGPSGLVLFVEGHEDATAGTLLQPPYKLPLLHVVIRVNRLLLRPFLRSTHLRSLHCRVGLVLGCFLFATPTSPLYVSKLDMFWQHHTGRLSLVIDFGFANSSIGSRERR